MIKSRGIFALLSALALVAVACTSSGSNESNTSPADLGGEVTTSPSPTTAVTSGTNPQALLAGVADSSELPGDLPAVTGAWGTDWTRTTIPFEELRIGIFASDPRDAIAPIDNPQFESVTAGAEWLDGRAPGVFVRYDGGARFYPLAILTLHEIVNDQIGDVPIAVTYCPLCNTGVVFDRRIDGTTHRFGVSGLLRKSDLVMWDDITNSLWQQITGEGIVGTYAGIRLTIVPASIVSFSEFSETAPEGEVMSRSTGFNRTYGLNPYEFYSSRGAPFAFFDEEVDDRFPALERVVGVSSGGVEKAYPFSVISGVGVVNDVVAGTDVVVFWGGDTADALDSSLIDASQAVGTAVAYSPIVDGQKLTFRQISDSVYEDDQTGSRWTILGVATDGPLAGELLELIVHRNEFWFAWAAFFPDGEVYGD
ncbi:MAG: DUF3179 domain-containing protein [Acidobacteria bacterium]|nr:DUF3179 domain-containing protein [Acidobacteriota bacterium]